MTFWYLVVNATAILSGTVFLYIIDLFKWDFHIVLPRSSEPKVPDSEPSQHVAGTHSLLFPMLVQCKPIIEPQFVANTKL